ncbi:MAG: precorrin-4 C(11)-methyltransferase [Treponema sp.]|jgi:precorrin-4/cobalt-precorrin-4 C11-methyltransferase|nr:precorrin-4 C(11)-methyltransferase [Treponema sp.]
MGEVHFVGAGPGAVDLITLRGKMLLERADVLIYTGSLVNPLLLDFTKETCVTHNSACLTLDEVIDRMAEAVSRDLEVVRLHTGDPSLYGAIREQIDRLNRLGIAWDICPGVSSFCAAAAALGVELTLPSVSQSVIITRYQGHTGVPASESPASLAVHGSTMVFFLSASLLDTIAADLISSGSYSVDTPAAIVYKASWAEQKVLRGTLGTLHEMAQSSGITKTALVLVGKVLGTEYALSRLYAPDFSTAYRQGSASVPKADTKKEDL